VLFFLISWSELSLNEHSQMQLGNLLTRLLQERPKRVFALTNEELSSYEFFYIDIIKDEYPEVANILVSMIFSPLEIEMTIEKFSQLPLNWQNDRIFLETLSRRSFIWIANHMAKTGNGIWDK
jgi:hypothetical protein